MNVLHTHFVLAASDPKGKIEYYYDEDENVLYERFTGQISMTAIISYLGGLEEIAFRDGCRVFADFSAASGLNLDLRKIKRISESSHRITFRIRRMRVALLTRDSISWGVANCFAFLARRPDYQIQVFNDVSQCADYLNLHGLAAEASSDLAA